MDQFQKRFIELDPTEFVYFTICMRACVHVCTSLYIKLNINIFFQYKNNFLIMVYAVLCERSQFYRIVILHGENFFFKQPCT